MILNIVGQAAVAIPMSTTMNCSVPLSTDGITHIYAIWATGNAGYIQISPTPSTTLTTTTGLLLPNAEAPILCSVPPMNQIAAISGSSGTIGYIRVQ